MRGDARNDMDADFVRLLDCQQLVVVVNDFNKYPEVENGKPTPPGEMIPKIDITTPLLKEIRTDNGPTFQWQEFADYLKPMNINHQKVLPRWPEANGNAENFSAHPQQDYMNAQDGEGQCGKGNQ